MSLVQFQPRPVSLVQFQLCPVSSPVPAISSVFRPVPAIFSLFSKVHYFQCLQSSSSLFPMSLVQFQLVPVFFLIYFIFLMKMVLKNIFPGDLEANHEHLMNCSCRVFLTNKEVLNFPLKMILKKSLFFQEICGPAISIQ